MKYICKYCNKEFNKYQQLGSHTRLCNKNPKYDERIKLISKSSKENNGMSKLKNRKKLSKVINEKVKNGTWHNSFSRARTYEYKGVKLYGTWELEYAKWLDNNDIKWERPKQSFEYIINGKKSRYTPDFYLIKEDIYVEIKGYETKKDRAKWKYFPKTLIVLKGKELKEMGIIENYKDMSK